MKPKPFASLNHFTVPVMRAMADPFSLTGELTVPALPAIHRKSGRYGVSDCLSPRRRGRPNAVSFNYLLAANSVQVLRASGLRSKQVLGSACDVAGGPSAIATTEGDVGHRRRGMLAGVSLYGSGTRWTTEWRSRTVLADQVKDLSGIVRIWTRLTHRPSDNPASCATFK